MGAQWCSPSAAQLPSDNSSEVPLICAGVCSDHFQPSPLIERIVDAVSAADVEPTGGGAVTMLLAESRAEELGLGAAERELVATIFHKVTGEAVEDLRAILQGAHVLVIGDDGWFYDRVKAMDGAYCRISSHASTAPQYSVGLGHLRTILVGQDIHGDSWFQFEACEWRPGHNPCRALEHATNWLEYHCTGLNVGPLGYSKHTDGNPLFVHTCASDADAAQQLPEEYQLIQT